MSHLPLRQKTGRMKAYNFGEETDEHLTSSLVENVNLRYTIVCITISGFALFNLMERLRGVFKERLAARVSNININKSLLLSLNHFL